MKVLDISGNPFSKVLNNGKTHEALFSAFSSDELCQLYVRPVLNKYIDFDYCGSYYCVSDWDVLNRILHRSSLCGEEIEVNMDMPEEIQVEKYSDVKKFKIAANNGLLGIIRDLLWSSNVWKTKELDYWLEKEKPDILFLDGGGDCFLYNIAIYIKNKLNIPLISYFTDDFFLYTRRNSMFKKIHISRLEKKLRLIVGISSMCYAIGEKMASEYGVFFSKDFKYIMNSIDVKPLKFNESSRGKIQISYFGNLGLNRGEMILRLGNIINDIADIHVYTFNITDYLKRQFEEKGIIYHKGVSGIEFESIMENSEVLLHVESDDIENRSFTKLAVSTKIPEYMMNSKVVLGFGPKEIASMELIYKNNLGIFIDSEMDDDEIWKTVESLRNNKLRKEWIRRSHNYALDFFDRRKNSESLKHDFKKYIMEYV